MNLRQAHLQEVGLVMPLNENQGPSQLHGFGLWLMCKVALIVDHPCSVTNTYCKPNIVCHSLKKNQTI